MVVYVAPPLLETSISMASAAVKPAVRYENDRVAEVYASKLIVRAMLSPNCTP